MALFARRPTLDEAIERIRAELRAGTAPMELLDELRRRDQPLVSGGREPPGLQEMLEAVPGAAALLEVGGRMVARNATMARLFGRGSTVLEATRSAELHDLCARGLAGWPQRREVSLPALDLYVEAQVAPLTHARALLVVRDLTAERRADRRHPRCGGDPARRRDRALRAGARIHPHDLAPCVPPLAPDRRPPRPL